jgi:ABC-type transport system involved in multi-copper enzyme maturation permease subunit
MTWLMWRQHRSMLLVVAGTVISIAVLLVLSGIPIHAAFAQEQIPSCLHRNPSSLCQVKIGTFNDTYFDNNNLLGLLFPVLLVFLPLVMGMLIGAPLIAQEMQLRTYQLVWTQGVTRQRWLTVKILSVFGVSVLAGGMITGFWMWWRAPFDAIIGRLLPFGAFDLEGIVPIGYICFAVAAAIAAGAIWRRPITAMVMTFLAFIVVHATLIAVRYSWLPTQTITWDPLKQSNPNVYQGDWVVQDGWVDSQHRLVPSIVVDNTCQGNPTCTHAHGWLLYNIVQPAQHFWLLQGIEAGICMLLAGALIGLTYWVVTRRLQ